jgi:hypothetical protein
MRTQRWLLVLTGINLAILSFLVVSNIGTAMAENAAAPSVVRARAFEVVDDQGRVRASLQVLPAQTQPNGAKTAETVLLRLITELGRPSIKISASEAAAGMAVTGPTGTNDSYLILEADRAASSLRLRAEDGRQTTIAPAKQAR